MRGLRRDMRKVWVSLYSSREKVTSGGRWTGEWHIARSQPFPVYATITPGKPASRLSPFGVDVDCERVVTIDHVGTGITEESVLWVDSEPAFGPDGLVALDSNGDPTVPYDYCVTGVAESPNVTSLSISRAK